MSASSERLELLRKLQSEVAAAATPAAAAQTAVTRLGELVPGLRFSVIIFDEASNRASIMAVNPPGTSRAEAGISLPLRVLSLPPGLRHGEVHRETLQPEQNGRSSPLAEALAREGIMSYSLVPLLAGGLLVGTVNIDYRRPAVDQKAEELAQVLAPVLALALKDEASAGSGREAYLRYRSLFEGTPVGLYRMDLQGVLCEVNPAFTALLGFQSPAELEGIALKELWEQEQDAEELSRRLERVGTVRGFEARMRRRDGRIIWVRNSARLVHSEEGEPLHFQGSLEDVTERRLAEERLMHDALYDGLTGLPNRAFFTERLQHALEFSRRRSDYEFAVLYLDFDRFKVINDSLGHFIGDELLTTAGKRLATCLRQVDTLARLGGDEFGILLDGINDLHDATHVAERIHYALAAPMLLQGNEVITSASIGIAIGRPGYRNPAEILRDADIAMYRAKEEGPGKHVVFDSAMHERAVAQMNLESDLRRAVERNEFVLHYQPIISLDNHSLMGFEALVRWQHPEKGLRGPEEFMRTAEETGLIVMIGRWVLEEAVSQVAHWQREFPECAPLSVSVNLSSKQFHHPDLLEDVRRALTRSGLQPEGLHLEITEEVLVEYPKRATGTFSRLKDLGVHLDIDDFGTGYSSLSMLSHFPVDVLKTDRSFISRMNIDESDREIVRAVFSLAKSLGLKVVAEGVETADQLARLRAMGCQFAQGFFFARPVTAGEARRLLQTAGAEGDRAAAR